MEITDKTSFLSQNRVVTCKYPKNINVHNIYREIRKTINVMIIKPKCALIIQINIEKIDESFMNFHVGSD